MKAQSIVRNSLLAVIALLPAALTAAETKSVREAALEKEGMELMGQVEDVARSVRNNTDTLLMHSRNGQISKWTHYHYLGEIKTLVNEGLRPALDRLGEIQSELPEWHSQAIDKMMDSARSLAADANAALLNQNASGTLPAMLNAEYRAMLESMNAHSQNLLITADAAADYASAHRQAVETGLIPRN
ncbi:MAG: hypothetical protein KGN84_01460 [Acidobacteriota bacterium]|nr:hypothetical protein [Acidobacteriota bacterium]